jgi:flagellar hook protein FlgE
MSIYGAMFSGVSGLFAQSTKISAISDNISNANTVGYKRTDVPFSTLVTSQGLQHSYSAGGVRANPYMHIDQQGLLNSTASTTDLAVNGRGMFVVNTAPEAATGAIANRTLFTRAGSFQPDANGYLRNTAGYYLQGWKLDSGGAFVNGEPARTSFASLETVNVTGLNFTGTPTENITFAGNLPAAETGGALPGNPIQTGVEYFDPLGQPKTLNLQWTPGTDYGAWTLDVVQAGETIPVASYEVQFHTSGAAAGSPQSIQEVWSIVGQRNAVENTDNPNTFTGEELRFDVNAAGLLAGGNPWEAGDQIRFDFNGNTFDYTLQAADVVDEASLANALATAVTDHQDIASAVVNGTQITLTGADTAEGASLHDNVAGHTITNLTDGLAPGLSGAGDFGTPGTDNANTYTGDIIEVSLENAVSEWAPGDVITINIGGETLDYTMTGADADDATLATNLANHLNANTGSFAAFNGGAVANGYMLEIPGTDDLAGASLVENSTELVGAVTARRDTTSGSTFVDDEGVTIVPSAAGDPVIARLALNNAGTTQTVDLHLGEIDTLEGITQFAGDYAPTLIERDGAQFGSLDRIEVGEDGIVSAVFNNGQTRPLYQVPLIDFVNPNGLLPVDGNAFQATVDAGAYYMWDPGVGPAGEIASSSLEASTVDIAEEFSNMIIAQRAYSSNARIIQTADEMLQEITNLKR